jgi:hypothetical protein
MAKKKNWFKTNWDLLLIFGYSIYAFIALANSNGDWGSLFFLLGAILVTTIMSGVIIFRTLKSKKLNNLRLFWISPFILVGVLFLGQLIINMLR